MSIRLEDAERLFGLRNEQESVDNVRFAKVEIDKRKMITARGKLEGILKKFKKVESDVKSLALEPRDAMKHVAGLVPALDKAEYKYYKLCYDAWIRLGNALEELQKCYNITSKSF